MQAFPGGVVWCTKPGRTGPQANSLDSMAEPLSFIMALGRLRFMNAQWPMPRRDRIDQTARVEALAPLGRYFFSRAFHAASASIFYCFHGPVIHHWRPALA